MELMAMLHVIPVHFHFSSFNLPLLQYNIPGPVLYKTAISTVTKLQ